MRLQSDNGAFTGLGIIVFVVVMVPVVLVMLVAIRLLLGTRVGWALLGVGLLAGLVMHLRGPAEATPPRFDPVAFDARVEAVRQRLEAELVRYDRAQVPPRPLLP